MVPSKGAARVAVSVSKKISKQAVERNGIRRRAYAVVSKIISNLEPGLYLILAKPGAKGLHGQNLENEINKLLVVSRQL